MTTPILNRTFAYSVITAQVALVVIVSLLLTFDHGLYNAQIGFFTAALVILGSFLGYKRMVDQGVANQVAFYERDELDKIDDPYDLYDDEEPKPVEDDASFKEVVVEEKLRLKKKTSALKAVRKGARGTLSLFRIFAYALLVLGFFHLLHKAYFEPIAYLIGITLGILAVSVAQVMVQKRDQKRYE
jgi:hypothetical protein